MIDKEFATIGLYAHNAKSYRLVRKSFLRGEKIVGIVQATGTGKTYQALQLAYDNKDKKITYIVPSNAIIEHIESIIAINPNIDREKDFPNLEFRTYQSLINLSREEIKNLNIDLLILDEFHHIGAPVWGSRIEEIIATHQDIRVFGMSAYTVRDRGTIYERDMALEDGKEIFSNKIVSRYDLVDAMLDGVLPRPIYHSAYIHLLGMLSELELLLENAKTSSKDYLAYRHIVDNVKKELEQASSIKNIIQNSLKKDGKYIYFCPIGVNVDKIIAEAKTWFSNPDDVVIYKSTSMDGEVGKQNRVAFYNDLTLDGKDAKSKLRIIFAINQYNEGVHSPGVDGVILARDTMSDIVYFEQIGRALSVRGDNRCQKEEYESYSLADLKALAQTKNITIKDTDSQETIINKLLAPIIIDLSGNIEFIKELENNLQEKVKELTETSNLSKRDINPEDYLFDITMENQDLFAILKDLKERLAPRKWKDMYLLASNYNAYYGNLDVPHKFKTTNGYEYDPNGYSLGAWIIAQRSKYNAKKLSTDKISKLLAINMNFIGRKNIRRNLNEVLVLARNYYERYGNLDVPNDFRTSNGFLEDKENGTNLHNWINNVRNKLGYTLTKAYFYETGRLDEIFERIPFLPKEEFYSILSVGVPLSRKKENMLKNKALLEKYNISEDELLILLKRSNEELKAIISYLTSSDLPVCLNGKMHELFFLTGLEMKEKYGFYKSDLVYNYVSTHYLVDFYNNIGISR